MNPKPFHIGRAISKDFSFIRNYPEEFTMRHFNKFLASSVQDRFLNPNFQALTLLSVYEISAI